MKYLKRFNESKAKKEYDSSVETVNQFVSDVLSLLREHYYIYELDIESIKNIVEYFERKTKNKIIELIPINYNDNDLKLIITLIVNMGYSTSHIKGWSYDIMGKVIDKICNSFSFDDEHPDKEWVYNGVDIEHFSILASTWNLKDALTPDKIEYHMERADKIDEYSMFRLIFQKIYQYGYSIANIEKNKKQDNLRNRVDQLMKKKDRTHQEEEEFTKVYKEFLNSMD